MIRPIVGQKSESSGSVNTYIMYCILSIWKLWRVQTEMQIKIIDLPRLSVDMFLSRFAKFLPEPDWRAPVAVGTRRKAELWLGCWVRQWGGLWRRTSIWQWWPSLLSICPAWSTGTQVVIWAFTRFPRAQCFSDSSLNEAPDNTKRLEEEPNDNIEMCSVITYNY